jgi:hypothetical protein
MARPPTSKAVGFARGALLLSLLVGCSGSAKTELPRTSDGDAGAAGATTEPDESGGNGGEPSRNDAGDAAGGAVSAEGGVWSGGSENAGGAGGALSPISDEPAYGASVESFEPGTGAGYNQDKLPGIVLGAPVGKGNQAGSLDVVSLGVGGEIVLAFGEVGIVDGPGPDLIVFENAFWPGGNATQVFYELGEVSVSEDGEAWATFPCDSEGDGKGSFPGCAGWTPTLVYDAKTLVPLDPVQSGGDAFDLADVGLKHARFIKIRDLQTLPVGGTTTGFDLDAVAAIHAQ